MGTRPTAIADERRVRESSHGETADGHEVFPRRGSVRMARDPSHGEAASG